MAVSLDPTLEAALDGVTHRPICKLVAGSLASDIPFDGELLNTQTTAESNPELLFSSTTNRLLASFIKGYDLYLVYSDTAQTTWTEVMIFDGSVTEYPISVSMIELSNNNIGVFFVTKTSTNYVVKYMVISQTGSVVTSAATIVSYATATYTVSGASLVELSTGAFMAVFQRFTISGATYEFLKTSGDSSFASWSVPAAISISGLISTREINNPDMLMNQAGEIYLAFDYVNDVSDTNEQKNLYYSVSANDGSTWSAATALTTLADYASGAVHPSIAEDSDGDIAVVYHEQISVLKIDSSTTGYCTSDSLASGNYVTNLFYDEATKKLYSVGIRMGSGYKTLLRVLVIDVDTWTIEKCYKQDGSPGWNQFFSDSSNDGATYDTSGQAASQDGYYLALVGIDNAFGILLINHQTETVTEYIFRADATWGLTSNINYTSPYGNKELGVAKTFLDVTNDKMYVLFAGEYALKGYYVFGYITLSDTADPITGKYDFNIINNWTDSAYIPSDIGLHVSVDEGLFIVSTHQYVVSKKGKLWVFNLSTGSLYKTYTVDLNSGFHYNGAYYPVLKNNKIYSGIDYRETDGQSARRGLMIIDMNTDAITYERPTYASVDQYTFSQLKLIDSGTRILMGSNVSGGYGVVIYDIASKVWTNYNKDTIPGFLTGDDVIHTVAYNEADDIIYAHTGNANLTGDENIYGFREGGSIYRGKYILGTWAGAAYNFGSAANLHLNSGGFQLSAVYDASDVLWNFWNYYAYSAGEYSIMWDRDSFTPDLQTYIPEGSEVTIEWEIGRVAKATFTLARGDLFDVTNTSSIYASVLRKGKIVDIYMGEKSGGTEYWQLQGRFLVVSTSINYNMGVHPTVTVNLEDRSTMFDQIILTATEGFTNADTDDVIDALLGVADIESADYTIPTITKDHGLYMQWIDESLWDALTMIMDHFGYFMHWGVDMKWTMKPISLSASVNHDYSANAAVEIIDYTPDNVFSNFVNRVIVKCEGLDFLEVLWDEERIESLSGTMGFWSKESDKKVWFSKDKTRRCRYPRLDVIESINDYSPIISMLGGNGDEYISYEDPNETYCIVTIEAPDRGLYVFAFAAAVLATGIAALYCDAKYTCGISLFLLSLSLSALIEVISAVANYRYDIWARPLGHEKQTYQATANDTEFQNELNGLVVPHEFEDPLSYYVEHCQMVADHEIEVAKGQRNRVEFTKVAHLADEVGDTIKVAHPISGYPITLFIPKLKRTFTMPTVGGEGEFYDTISGWKQT